jgi:RNA polymerase sigma factor (sigma-70 family)
MSELTFEKFLADHRNTLEALFAASGAAKWSVPFEDFASVAWKGIAPAAMAEPRKVRDLLISLRVGDLGLVLGCLAGNEQAWNTFSFEYQGVLFEAARAILHDDVLARELADSLLADLYGLNSAEPGRDSKLNYFHGRSSLKTWLRSVLYQRFVDEYRRQSRLDPLPESAAQPAAIESPVSETDERRYDGYLSEAVEAALRDLPASEKLLLSYAYVQKMTLKQIGRLQGEHEATVSRHLAALRKKLKKRIEGYLRKVRKLSAFEVDRCLDFAVRGVSVDLDRMLKPE